MTDKAAFVSGVRLFCKRAGMDADDADQMERLLLMPVGEARPIVKAARLAVGRANYVKAGMALLKAADYAVADAGGIPIYSGQSWQTPAPIDTTPAPTDTTPAVVRKAPWKANDPRVAAGMALAKRQLAESKSNPPPTHSWWSSRPRQHPFRVQHEKDKRRTVIKRRSAERLATRAQTAAKVKDEAEKKKKDDELDKQMDQAFVNRPSSLRSIPRGPFTALYRR